MAWREKDSSFNMENWKKLLMKPKSVRNLLKPNTFNRQKGFEQGPLTFTMYF